MQQKCLIIWKILEAVLILINISKLSHLFIKDFYVNMLEDSITTWGPLECWIYLIKEELHYKLIGK